jgi:hypothetical protein
LWLVLKEVPLNFFQQNSNKKRNRQRFTGLSGLQNYSHFPETTMPFSNKNVYWSLWEGIALFVIISMATILKSCQGTQGHRKTLTVGYSTVSM